MASAALQAGRVINDAALSRVRDSSRSSASLLRATSPGPGSRTTSTATPPGARPARRPDRDGRCAARRLRGDRQHRLRDDGRGARALRHPDACGTSAAAASSIAPRTRPATSGCMREPLKPFAANCAAARLLAPAGRAPATAAHAECETAARHAGRDRRRARPARGRWRPHYVLAVQRRGRVIHCAFTPIRRAHTARRDEITYDRHIRCCPAEHRHAAADRLGRLDQRGRQRPSDDLPLGRRHRGGAVLRRDALRSEEPRRTPTTIASCCRRGTPRRFSTPRGPRPACFRASELLKLRTDRLGSRRASDAAAAVRRRRDRFARAGHLRRDRHRAQRAAHRLRLPHLRPARRRRDGRRLGLGSGRRRRSHYKLDNLCAIIDVNGARPEPADRSSATRWTRSPRAGTRSAGTRSSSTATTSRALQRRWPRRAPPSGRPTVLLARTLKGKGLVGDRRQGGLARQGAEEGRGDRQGDRRAREADASTTTAEAGDPEAAQPQSRPETRRPTTRSCRRPPTRWAIWSRRAKPGAPRSPASARSIARIVALDADVKNSTFSDQFEKVAPDRFFEIFIAEQVMVGAAMGLAARGAIPFPSTFACFLTARRRLHPHGRHLDARTSSSPARTPACRSARTDRRRWRSRISR